MSALSLLLSNRLSELDRVAGALAEFADRQALPAPVRFDLELAVEEMLLNVIQYAYDDDEVHQIGLKMRCEGRLLSVEISDDGRPFNPLEAPAPDLEAPLEQRPLGGLGIYLVRQTMDSLCYRREGGRNYLLLHKRIPA